MQQAKQAVVLNPGTSYWVDLNTPKGSRKMPLTVIDIGHGQMMGADYKGRLFNLPDNIVGAHQMNEWARLMWAARCYKRNDGEHEKAHDLMKEAYHAMPDAWYTDRIERLTNIWGPSYDDLLQERIDELHRFRPDLPIDELTFVKKQRSCFDQLIAAFDSVRTSQIAFASTAESPKRKARRVSFINRVKSLPIIKNLF